MLSESVSKKKFLQNEVKELFLSTQYYLSDPVLLIYGFTTTISTNRAAVHLPLPRKTD